MDAGSCLMHVACRFLGGSADDTSAITDFAPVWVWVALAGWLLVFAAMFGHGLKLVREDHARNLGKR
jgi:hypothetical protein